MPRIVGELIFDADDGLAVMEGMVTPKGLRVVMESAHLLAVKWPGSNYHSGIGQPQGYAPGEWIIFEDVRSDPALANWRHDTGYRQPDERNRIHVDVREVMRWPLRT